MLHCIGVGTLEDNGMIMISVDYDRVHEDAGKGQSSSGLISEAEELAS